MCLHCRQLLWSMEVLQLKSSPVETAVQHRCKEFSANKKPLITQLVTLKGELSLK